jgi:GDP/UDP-N,N'-diacetylbacillosamine 2-epimerase (hydrolysing)
VGASLAIQGFERALRHHKPDAVIVLGDRWEIFAGVIPAYMMGIPVVHLHGGDVTAGSLDDGYRDCITRLSSLHLVSNDDSATRILEILDSDYIYPANDGGDPSVINVGALREDLSDISKTKFEPGDPHYCVLLFNPVTTLEDNGFRELKAICSTLSKKEIGITAICGGQDQGGYKINWWINTWQHIDEKKWSILPSMPRQTFLAILADADFIIGNSSAGITEAPALGTPTINIGDRQKGRMMASSVINCEGTEEGIREALVKLESKEFQDSLRDIDNPYSGGMTAVEILGIIKEKICNTKF